MLKFGQEEKVMLVILLFTYKKPELLIKLLVDLFCWFVGLWMLSSEGGDFDSKQVVELFCKKNNKLKFIVRYNICKEAIMLSQIV